MFHTLINLTPHELNLVDSKKVITSYPSEGVARVSSSSTPVGVFEQAGNIPLTQVTFGQVEGLPPPDPGVLFVVSALVRAAVPHRRDVASPGDLVRDESGRVVGASSLILNTQEGG